MYKRQISSGAPCIPWSLTLAANTTAAVWSDGNGNAFDFNDGITDGTDADSVGGALTVDPPELALTPLSGAPTASITKGPEHTFAEGTADTATIVTAAGTDAAACSWEITDIPLSQRIPPFTPTGDYSLDMTLTLTAQ